jgi:hypothetical protein
MNNYFEKNKIKTFNVFPSRSNIIPKHITLDIASINVIFCNNRYKSLETNKKIIYQEIFKFPDSYFKINNKFEFSGTIQTDGVSLSLLYLLVEQYEKKKNMNVIKHNAKNEAFKIKKEIKELKIINEDCTNKLNILLKNKQSNINEIKILNKQIKETYENKEQKEKIKKKRK